MAYIPQITENAKAFHEKMFPGYESKLAKTDPEFIERFDNFAFDEVVNTIDLDDKTRALGWIATLIGCQGIEEYRAMLPAALELGLSPEEVKEVVYQAVDYCGIGRVFPFLHATNEVFEERGIALPLQNAAQTKPSEESRLAGGEECQINIFGEGMHGYKDKGKPNYPWINKWLVDNCFGDFYTRKFLNLAQREIITFCFIAAQGGCEPQLKSHAAGCLGAGNTYETMVKVVSSNLPFIGYPRTLNALAALDSTQQ